KLVFKLASAVTLYSAVLLSLVTVGSVLTLIQRYTTFLSKINTFERAIEQTYMSLPFVFMAVGPFLYCTEIWKRIQFINSWGTFQEQFNRVTNRRVHLGLRYRVYCLVALSLTSAVSGPISISSVTENFKLWQYCICALGLLLGTVMPALWYLTCHGTIRAAKDLGDEIEKGLQNNSFRQNDKLVQFKFLWLHLSKLTQNIGRSMGFTYAMFTLYCNVVMVIASYVFLVLIRNGFHKHILGQTVGILVSLATLYAQCTNAQSATEEVGLNFQERIQSMLQKYPPLSPTTHIEMDRFLAVINSNPPVVSFCGFVEVNRGLITSLMSQLLTYLIVLLQINLSTHPDESDKQEDTIL
ncbi:hypothetical protein Cfor_06773, partial [Coptotermes formosanus]